MIPILDLKGQYLRIKDEIDSAVANVIDSCKFINGPQVKEFAEQLAEYTGAKYVIPVANGTDALQVSLMSLRLNPGDEIIVPSFTYIASAEVIALLNLVPVMVDVDYNSFNTTAENIQRAISRNTKAIIPVHLFGQSCPMESILNIAKEHHLHVIEDNAQSIGAEYTFQDGTKAMTGTMGTFGCLSFFPSKNLGCMGDGGAILTNDYTMAERARMIASHGQSMKYFHEMVGCNSRLDTIQAAVLSVKLKYLNEYTKARQKAAEFYDNGLAGIKGITIPQRQKNSTHVFHQYTIKVSEGKRDGLKQFLLDNDIQTMVYYPRPLQRQQAFRGIVRYGDNLDISEQLSNEVLSIPMHTELTEETQQYIIDKIKEYAENNF